MWSLQLLFFKTVQSAEQRNRFLRSEVCGLELLLYWSTGNSATVLLSGPLLLLFFFLLLSGLHLWHLEIPRLGLNQSSSCLPKPQPEQRDLSCICDPYSSSWQFGVLNPRIEATDWTHVLLDTSWVHYHWATRGTQDSSLKKFFSIVRLISISQDCCKGLQKITFLNHST